MIKIFFVHILQADTAASPIREWETRLHTLLTLKEDCFLLPWHEYADLMNSSCCLVIHGLAQYSTQTCGHTRAIVHM